MMPGDDVLMMPVARRIEVFTGPGQRRRWSADAKAQIVAESYETSVGEVAERYSLAKTQVFTWRRDARRSAFAQVVVDDAAPGSDEAAADGAIEIELLGARVRIGREADARMAVAVIGALRAGR
jgi:transposase